MPGGNSTARPYNRDEKKAAKTVSAAKDVSKRIRDRVVSGDLGRDAGRRLRKNLMSGKVTDAEATLQLKNLKQRTRDARKLAGLAKGGAVKKSYGGKMKKMAGGGMCRGMGAATKGGKYRMT